MLNKINYLNKEVEGVLMVYLCRYFLLAFLLLSYTCNDCFLDITAHGYEQYQDIIINNEVVKPASAGHDCSSRYEVIRAVFDKYSRQFTMLDIGASQGYYSFRTAHDYDSVCVMIEGNNPAYPMIGTQLLELCKLNTSLDNIILLNKKIIPEDLQMLSECEHFDVILAMNVIHWFDKKWKNVADAILNMGDNIIIETPPQESVTDAYHNNMRKQIEDYIVNAGGIILGKVKRHSSNTFSNIYLIEKNKKYLERNNWLKTSKFDKDSHYVDSSFREKKLTKKVAYPPDTWMTADWVPGINLVTFKMYDGRYPSNDIVSEGIKKLKNQPSNDWMPNNMIIQGNAIAMIDINDPNHNPGGYGGGRRFSQKQLDNILKWAAVNDPAQVSSFFWNNVVPFKNRSRR